MRTALCVLLVLVVLMAACSSARQDREMLNKIDDSILRLEYEGLVTQYAVQHGVYVTPILYATPLGSTEGRLVVANNLSENHTFTVEFLAPQGLPLVECAADVVMIEPGEWRTWLFVLEKNTRHEGLYEYAAVVSVDGKQFSVMPFRVGFVKTLPK